jgi:hypothetical protein
MKNKAADGGNTQEPPEKMPLPESKKNSFN